MRSCWHGNCCQPVSTFCFHNYRQEIQHLLLCLCRYSNKNIVAAFRGMHVSPAKHNYGWLPRKCDYRTDIQTEGRTDRQTPDKVIPICRYASQATQWLQTKGLSNYDDVQLRQRYFYKGKNDQNFDGKNVSMETKANWISKCAITWFNLKNLQFQTLVYYSERERKNLHRNRGSHLR